MQHSSTWPAKCLKQEYTSARSNICCKIGCGEVVQANLRGLHACSTVSGAVCDSKAGNKVTQPHRVYQAMVKQLRVEP